MPTLSTPDREAAPLVSIIVPARNPRPDWLEAAVASAFDEPDCRIEVIIVDDGSEPAVDSRAQAFQGLDVRVLRIEPGGASRARNVGLEHCAGDYVRFLDADDVFVRGSTSKLVRMTRSAGKSLVYGGTVLCDADLVPFGAIRSRRRGRVDVDTALGRFHVTLPAILFPSEIVKQIGPYDERLAVQQDWDYVLRATEVASVVGTTAPVYLYRRHPESNSSRPAARRAAMRSTAAIIRSYLARHPELAGTRAERRIRAFAQFDIARLRGPRFPLRSPRFRKAALADPVRGSWILAVRASRLALRRARTWLSRGARR